MTIYTQSSESESTLTIRVEGKFDFASHADFRNAYRSQIKTGIKYQIDLSKVDYMDSSALGMLLMIKEHAEVNKGTVTLYHPPPDIRGIFEMANFYALFTIEN